MATSPATDDGRNNCPPPLLDKAVRNSTSYSTLGVPNSDQDGGEKGRGLWLCGKWRLPPLRVLVSLAACVMIEMTLGKTYTTGTLMPYLTSYMRNVTGDTSVDYGRTLWISNSVWLVLAGCTAVLGLVQRRVPARLYLAVGFVVNALSLFGTCWAVQSSLALTVVVYGVLQGLANAILYPGCLHMALNWFPGREGLVGGVTMAGYGGGAFVWNQVVTFWINPNNLQPDQADGDNLYFTQSSVLERVPTCFLVLGAIISALQLVCLLVISNPPPPPSANTQAELTSAEVTSAELKPAEVKSAEVLASEVRSPEVRSAEVIAAEVIAEEATSGNKGESPQTGQRKMEVGEVSGETEKAGDGEEYREEESTAHSVHEAQRQISSSLERKSEKSHGETSTDTDMPEYKPLQILTSRVTWTLWLTNFSIDQAFFLIPAFYKAYGQTFIHDDHLLTLVASCASVFNAFCRPLWGMVGDRIGFLPCLLVIQGLLALLSGTVIVSEEAGSATLFAVWMCAIYVCFAGVYALQAPVIFALFGPRTFVFSLGVVCSTGIVSTFTTVPLSAAVFKAMGWHGIFLVASAGAVMSTVFLASLLVSCGRPIPSHMRRSLLTRRLAPTLTTARCDVTRAETQQTL